MRERNFGTWLRKELHDMERSNEWLYRRVGIATGSINRWSSGMETSLGTSMKIFRLIANQKQTTRIKVIEQYLEYLGC